MVTQDITFMVYLVTLLKIVKIMVFIALRGFNVQIEELIGDFINQLIK